MMNLFKTETEESIIKLIATQSDLIAKLKEAKSDQTETISHLKRLVNLQDEQIIDLKLKLRQIREKQ
jgi:hypothetical protein